MQKTLVAAAAAWLLVLGADALACDLDEAKTKCTLPANPSVVTYWTSSHPSLSDPRCTNFFGTPLCYLHGYLYVPPGATSAMPAVVYVHGSGQKRARCSSARSSTTSSTTATSSSLPTCAASSTRRPASPARASTTPASTS